MGSEMCIRDRATADLSGLENGVFGMDDEAEQTWRRVLPRAEVMQLVETQPMTGHLSALMMKLEILRLLDAVPAPSRTDTPLY